MKKIILGSRGSRLALFQAELARKILCERFSEIEIEIHIMETEGDIDRASSLSSFEGRGAFVKSIETALLNNEIDVAVHSLKDLPSKLPEGLILGAVPVREDPSDVLISKDGQSLSHFPSGSIIATGSDRRITQLKKIRPDLSFQNIRGNIETRIGKVGRNGIEGIVLAYAGVKRLGFENKIAQIFTCEELLPAPCQGAIGLECRADDVGAIEMLTAVENYEIRTSIDTERTFIAELGMGCHAPVAAYARLAGREFVFSGLVADKEGTIYRENFAIPREEAQPAARLLAEKLRNFIIKGNVI
ncbi:MAG: hydroxymethylbilane synthase [Candidatus Latescibacterota bacterium]